MSEVAAILLITSIIGVIGTIVLFWYITRKIRKIDPEEISTILLSLLNNMETNESPRIPTFKVQ
jgi:sensor histidine kinase regulating citrate/malate metabolism